MNFYVLYKCVETIYPSPKRKHGENIVQTVDSAVEDLPLYSVRVRLSPGAQTFKLLDYVENKERKSRG